MNIITNYANNLKEVFKDNKKIILSCFAIFIIVTILAYSYGSTQLDPKTDSYSNIKKPEIESKLSDTLFFIMGNNIKMVLLNYMGGIFFGIISIVTLISSSITLGLHAAMYGFTHPYGIYRYIAHIIPHGIFELTAAILSSASGLILFKFIFKLLNGLRHNEKKGIKQKLTKSYQENKHILIQSLVLLIFCIILVIIAAPIETYISEPFSKFIVRY